MTNFRCYNVIFVLKNSKILTLIYNQILNIIFNYATIAI